MKYKTTYLANIIAICVVLGSCSNNIEEVNELTSVTTLPATTVKNIETIYSDSAVVKLKLTAAEYRHFESGPEKYDEYPQGLLVEFYGSHLNVVGKLSCQYARYFPDKNLWEVRTNVEAMNLEKDEKINTELLWWDMNLEEIYSDKFVRITTADEIIYGDGFRSNQDFSSWKIIKPKGTITINDEE
ncbi:MAG: LPS export ABC transporter periplasmic protein LptC [Bacteroidales bacterium]|nr:LPS export ABC transporter periplasmic protein LptC [Bacteroidales bacterium]HOY39034.1 LPS export ABC transporter periplasmic protein LptC [Bacteroidales bacterium]HQP04128.1 LPS export ABC transporter periplasmic protein LptC [Bacteroidales bacterium]